MKNLVLNPSLSPTQGPLSSLQIQGICIEQSLVLFMVLAIVGSPYMQRDMWPPPSPTLNALPAPLKAILSRHKGVYNSHAYAHTLSSMIYLSQGL